MIHRVLAIAMASAAIAQTPEHQAPEYRPYPGHDLTKALQAKDAGGKKTYAIDLKLIADAVNDLWSYARNYPPTFRAEDERQRATRDVKSLSELFDLLTKPKENEAEVQVLLLAGRLESMGHNLEIRGASTRAVRYFERLLARVPEHAKANLHFGAFLAGTATRQKDSLPYLEKALKLGEEEARFMLGIVNLTLRNDDQALAHLQAYAKLHPDHEQARVLIDAIRKGNVRGPESRPGEPGAEAASRPSPQAPEK